jgi:hypothetical protein
MGHLIALLALAALAAPGTDSASARRKVALIEGERLSPGASVTLSPGELNAYVRAELAAVAPAGLREPRVELGPGRATGYAYVDFPKLRQAQGEPLNAVVAWLVGGERSIRVDARIRSGGGKAQVNIERLEISGLVLSGGVLHWLIRKIVWLYYPEAQIDEPFGLAYRIDRLEVGPAGVRVVIGATRR